MSSDNEQEYSESGYEEYSTSDSSEEYEHNDEENTEKPTTEEKEETESVEDDGMEGGLKVKKNVDHKSTIQESINEDLLRTINIQAFLQEAIQYMVKNTVGIKCKKCGSDNVWVESKQVRSSDEATSKFYTCLQCGNKWRVD